MKEKTEKTSVKNKKSAETTASDSAKSTQTKAKRQVFKGKAHVQCTYNNTVVTITDLNGNVLAWASSGSLGFKGAKKSTPYAATQVAKSITEKVRKFGLKELETYVKGIGSGREAAVRALANNGFELTLIKDVTPLPHNGCRPRRPRRI